MVHDPQHPVYILYEGKVEYVTVIHVAVYTSYDTDYGEYRTSEQVRVQVETKGGIRYLELSGSQCFKTKEELLKSI